MTSNYYFPISPEIVDDKTILFTEARPGRIPGTSRINYMTANPLGKKVSLQFKLTRDTWGVQPNINPDDKDKAPEEQRINGYQLPLILVSDDNDEEQDFVEVVGRIVETTKEHLLQEKVLHSIDKDYIDSDLRKLNPLYYPKDKITKKPDATKSPTLYAKLLWSESAGITTVFYDKRLRRRVDPFDYIGQRMRVTVLLKFSSIFIGAQKPSIQCQITDVIIHEVFTQYNPLVEEEEAADQVAPEPKLSPKLPDQPKTFFEEELGEETAAQAPPEEPAPTTPRDESPPPPLITKKRGGARSTRKA